MKAFLKNYRHSPRKTRLVADVVRGKEVGKARTLLKFMNQKAAPTIKKLIESASANARQSGVANADDLVVKTIMVDQGFVMKRHRPRFGGRATPIRKPTSRITIELGEEPSAKKKAAKGVPLAAKKKAQTKDKRSKVAKLES